MRPGSLLVLAGALALAACAHDDGPARSEAAAVSRAVEVLRNADNAQKSAPLAALRALSCTVPEICGVQSLCVAAYEEHVRVLALIDAARASAASAPPDALKDALAAAEAGLARAKAQTDACASKQGELARKYKVAR
ncbi:MAG TPA: hypothetical protein VMI54_25455 [Polyangiaceae bacterium]|nr:hypothetical protein [Polyangiaceae bacterium]